MRESPVNHRAPANPNRDSLENSPARICHANPTPIRWINPAVLKLIYEPDDYRLKHCPQCQAKEPRVGHGFYRRTLVDVGFDGVIPVRR